jgi:phosphoadenosine phosphosulfate reductase
MHMPGENQPDMQQSRDIIRSSLEHFLHPVIAFSGGKRSLVLLHLARTESMRPVPIVFIDTGRHFDQIYHFIEKMQKLWKLQIITKKSPGCIPDTPIERSECCATMIAEPLGNAVTDIGGDCILMGCTGKDVLADIIRRTITKTDCRVVFPLSHVSDEEIAAYIRQHNLTPCSLYARGYKKVDCTPCSVLNQDTSAGNPEEEKLIREKLKKLGYL